MEAPIPQKRAERDIYFGSETQLDLDKSATFIPGAGEGFQFFMRVLQTTDVFIFGVLLRADCARKSTPD
jgi:hypothetical protein